MKVAASRAQASSSGCSIAPRSGLVAVSLACFQGRGEGGLQEKEGASEEENHPPVSSSSGRPSPVLHILYLGDGERRHPLDPAATLALLPCPPLHPSRTHSGRQNVRSRKSETQHRRRAAAASANRVAGRSLQSRSPHFPQWMRRLEVGRAMLPE